MFQNYSFILERYHTTQWTCDASCHNSSSDLGSLTGPLDQLLQLSLQLMWM